MTVKKIMCGMMMCVADTHIDTRCVYVILDANIIWEEVSQKPIKKSFHVTISVEGPSTVFEVTNFMSNDWFKNFWKPINFHNLKLIGKQASVEYKIEKVFPTKSENTK